MSGKYKALFKFLAIIYNRGWIAAKPVAAAAGLLMLAGILMVTVTVSLNAAHKGPAPLTDEQQAKSGSQPEPAPAAPVTGKDQSAGLTPAVEVTAQQAASQQAKQEQARWPVQGEISVPFGWQQHSVYNDWRYHTGIDIKGTMGQPVTAIFSGKVTAITTDSNLGLTVVIASGEHSILYGCLDSAAVSVGMHVAQGAKIGTMGRSQSEPYPHLHLAIKNYENNYIDPREILP